MSLPQFGLRKILRNVHTCLCRTGGLVPIYEFPAAPKAKSIYFLKRQKKPLPKKDIHEALIFGDLSNNPLEQLSVLVENVSS